jgi:fibronectin-binding autotransporter adhesin
MKTPKGPSPLTRAIGILIAVILPLSSGPVTLKAANFYWDADGSFIYDGVSNNSTSGLGLGGSGSWNTSSPSLWWDGSSTSLTTFTGGAADTALFTGAGGVVQLTAPISVGALTFGSTGFNITGDAGATNTLTLQGSGSTAGQIAVNNTGTDIIGAVIAGANGITLTSTTTGTVQLKGVNTYTGDTTITSGTLGIFSDSALGASTNAITFNGAAGTTATLQLNGPIVLNSSRQINLNNTGTGVAVISSPVAAAQVVLGKVTGTGTLATNNAGTTYLLNANNDFSGALWSQNGTLSTSLISDNAGNGNIRLGSGGSVGGFQWGTAGAGSPLVLSNRAIEFSGTTGGGTIDSSSIVAANNIVINNNLAFTSGATGAKTLTLTGVNAGINRFGSLLGAGNITDNGGATALTKSGLSFWQLNGSANTYTGAIAVNQGTLRIINSTGLGSGTGGLSFAGGNAGPTLEICSDVAPVSIRNITSNNATGTSGASIFVDHNALAGNTTTGQIITFGTVAQGNNGAVINFVGDHGYGVATGLTTLAASNGTAATLTTYQYNNFLGSPGLTGYSVGSNEFISIAGFAESGANTAGVTQTLAGWGNYTVTGPISNTGTQPVNITKSGNGILTYTPSTTSSWTLGTLTAAGGTTRITAAPTTAAATLTFGGGLVELRNDNSTNFTSNIGGITATSTLVVDHASPSSSASGNTATLGNVASNTAATLNVVGDHGYNLTLGNWTQKGAVSTTINNFLGTPGYTGYTGGSITLGNITTDATAGTATLVLGGFGDYTFGTLSSGAAGTALSITKSNLGVVTFAGSNSGWTSTTQGTLTASAGTTLINATNTQAVGSANLNSTGGLLEILSATGTSGAPWTTKNLTIGGSGTFVVDPLAGSSATGQTVNLGGLTAATQTTIINSNHGYNITFNAAGTQGNTSDVLSNVGNGTVTLAGGLTSTAATSTYTLNGPGDFNVSGNVTNGTGTIALTKSGSGLVTLGGTNTIGGTTLLNSGVLRITNAAALGGAGTLTINGGNSNAFGVAGVDLRNDTGMDLSAKGFTTNDYNFIVNVDKAIGGSGTNQTMSLGGGVVAGTNGWGFAAIGANGYSLQFKGTAFQEATAITTYQVSNFIPSVSGNGRLEFNSGITYNAIAAASAIILSGTGDYLLSGALTGTGATAVATLTKSGTGTLTVSTDNSATWNVATNNVITQTAGIIRATASNALGGSSAIYNLNTGTLDLRSDAGITLPTVKIGAVNSTINVDRAVGGAGTGGTQTITALNDSGVFSLYATGGTQSGGNAYNLAVTTFTVGAAGTAAIPTINNTIGGGGALNIATLAGGAGFNVFVNGSGNTNITTAMTANTGTLTKSGTGTLTISGPAGYAAGNTNGAITVNGGTLALDFTGITAPSNLLQSAAITLGAASAGGVSGGALTIKGAATGTTTQTLGALAVQAGLDRITLNANGGTSTTLTMGAITATNAGGQLLISSPASTTVSVATALNTAGTTGRNLVFFDGTNYNWATNTASGAAFIANNNAGSAAAVKYAALATTAGTDTSNSQVTASPTLGGARITNSLMINTSGAGGTLALGANMLTLTQGGLLFADSATYNITGTSAANGLKSATATNSDLVINNYGAGTLNIQAPIIQGTGTSTLTVGGTGTTVLGNSAVLATVGTYTGITYINGGTVKLASGITGLGAAASNTALTQNGGTLDINGNTVNIGAFNGGPAATIDNNPTSTTAATLTIGAGNGTGTFNGTIKDTNGALTIVKAGTGAITLGDAVTGGSNQFTGNLRFTGASTLTLNSLADTAGSKVDFNVSGANLTFVSRNNLTLNNRAFDISAAGGTATITSNSAANSINGTNAVMTIGSAFTPTGTGTLGLTLTGSSGNIANGGTGTGAGNGISGVSGSGNVAVVNSFNGNINDGAGTLALTLAGTGGWSLGGNNGYTGGTTISSTGLVRATSGTAFGTNTVNITGAAVTLDLRSDSSLTFANAITTNQSFTINTDRAVGGSAYAQIMNIGSLTQNGSAKTVTVSNLLGTGAQLGSSDNIVGYGLHMSSFNLGITGTSTIQNSLGSPGSAQFVIPTSGAGAAGALVIDAVSAAASLGTTTLNFGTGTTNNFGVTVLNGDITQGASTTLGITVTGGNGNAQFITLNGQTASTNYSGGLTLSPGSGGATVRVTNVNALGSGPVTFNGASTGSTLEVRNDSSLTFTNNVVVGNITTARTNTLAVGEALNGSSGRNNTFTFGTLGFQGITANALTVAGISGSLNNSGDSVTFGGVSLGNGSLNGAATFTVTNSLLLPGILSLGNVTSTNTTAGTTQTLTIAGAGVTTLGDVTNSSTATALTAINYTGTGILDLTRATSANTYSGNLTLAGGTARVANANGLGASTNALIFNAGTLELRSDSNITYSNPISNTNGGTINIGQTGNGTGATTGVTFTLGGLKPTVTNKTLTFNGIGGSLAASSDSVILGGVDLNSIAGTVAAPSTVITNNLQLPGTLAIGNVTSTGAGTALAVLGVSGSGVTTIGDVTNGTATAVALTYTGTGIFDLSRMTATTNYGGGFTQNGAGTTRITNLLQLGTNAGFALQNGNIEIRSDSAFTYNNPINWNSNNGSVGIFVGEVGTGTTTGIETPFTFGQLNISTASGKVLTIGGIGGSGANSGDSVTIGNVSLNYGVGTTNTITNNLEAPGSLTLGNITNPTSAAGTQTLAIGGVGVTYVSDVTNGTGTALTNLTNTGAGLLQITPTNTTNYTGGLTQNGTGILRVIVNPGVTSAFGASTNIISLIQTGVFDIRTDSNLTVSNPLVLNTNNQAINVDQIGNGNLSKTVTFTNNGNSLSLATGTAKTLTLTSGSNYGITFTNGFTVPITGEIITNNASGTVSLGAINYTGATGGSLTINGSGLTTVGNITTNPALATNMALIYSGTGLLDLTGNSGATGPLSAVTLSGAGGIARVNTPTNLGASGSTINMNGGTLQIRNDGSGSNGTISFTNPVALNGTATNIIDVSNTGTTSNTGNTVAFGAYTVVGASNNTTTFNGSNGYGVSFTAASLPSGAGQGTVLVANIPVSILGNVSNGMSGWTANTNLDTLFLDGVVGGTIGGSVADATGLSSTSTSASLANGGVTRITKQGTGTWTLNGANTNQGATAVNGGTLVVNGSSVSQNVYTVTGSNVFSSSAAPSATLSGTGNIGGNVILATGTATTFAQGATINPGLVGTAGTLTIGGTLTTNNFTNLNFDLSSSPGGSNDLISAAVTPVIGATTQVNVNTLGTLTAGSIYTLISGYTGTVSNLNLNTSLAAFTGVDTTKYGQLVNQANSVKLVILNQAPSSLYWSGAVDGNWNTAISGGVAATNWNTDATTGTDALAIPGVTTDVHFVTTNPVAGNLTTTLGGQNFSVNSISFDASSTNPVAINGTSTLTIGAGGLLMNAAAGAVTINTPVTLAASQTWTNNSTTNLLTLAGAVNAGANPLSIAGAGSTTISGAVTSTVSVGTVALTVGTGATLSMTNTANAIAGDMAINGGTVIYTGGTATTTNQLGVGSGSVFRQILLSNGGTFRVSTNDFNVNVVSTTNKGAGFVFNVGAGGGTFNVDSARTFTVDDGSTTGTATTAYQLQGTGDLTKAGTGTLILRNQNAFSGAINVTGGLLQASGTTIATSSTGITVQSGAALNLAGQLVTDTESFTISGTGLASSPAGAITNSTGTASYAGSVILAASSAIGGPGTATTLSGVITDQTNGYSLTKVGTSSLTLSNAANTYSGTLSINGGTLSVASLANSGSGSNGTGNIVFNNAAVTAGLTYTGSGATLTRGVSLQGSGGALNISNNGTGALVFNGTNVNSITGNTTLTLGGTYATTNNAMNGILADNGSSVLSLAKTGAGTWILGGANSFTGNVSIATPSNGNLVLTNSNSLGVGPKTVSVIDNTGVGGNSSSIQLDGSGGNITLASNISFTTSTALGTGGILNLAGDNVINGNFTLASGGGSTQFTSNGGTLSLTGTLTPNTTGRFVVLNGTTNGNIISGVAQNGSVTNTLGLIKQGTGEWILTGANTYTVGTQIQNGTLRVAGTDNRLLSTGAGNTNVVTLGSATTNTSGKLAIGGDTAGGTGAGTQRIQTLTQNSTSSVLTTAGTGTANSVIGASAGGTSSGTPANNSVINLSIGTGFTDTYTGLIGWDGTGSVGFQNNINLQKSGGGTLVLSADLSNWTGTQVDGGANVTDLSGDATRPELILSGGVLRLTSTATINTVIRNTGGVIDDLGANYGNNYFLIVSGGLISLSQTTDSFANSGLTSISHGVGALNITGNTGVVDVVNSDMYLGAVGARVFSNSTLAAGLGNTYRLGGGAPWSSLGSAAVGGSGGYLQVSTANVITGANAVVIGDNGTYNSGAGLFGNLSSVEFTAAQNFSGGLTILGGTLQFTNSNQLGSPTTSANSIVLDGGTLNNGYNAILRYGPSTTTDLSARIGINSGGSIDTGANTVAFATALANTGGGTGGLNKLGTGTLTLSKANTYAGPTTVSQGTLRLDFGATGATTSNILSNASVLGLSGGALAVNGVGGTTANTQSVVATNITGGSTTLNLSRTATGTGNLTLNLGLINRSTGTGLNIVPGTNAVLNTSAILNTTTTNSGGFGILSGGVTYNGTDWVSSAAASTAPTVAWDGATGGSTNVITLPSGSVTNGSLVSFNGTVPGGLSSSQAYYVVNASGSNFQVAATPGGTALTLSDSGTTATVNTAGAITQFSAYTTQAVASSWAANQNLTNGATALSGTIGTSVAINSLKISDNAAGTVALGAGIALTINAGILETSAVSTNTSTKDFTGATGFIQGPSGGGDIVINNFSNQAYNGNWIRFQPIVQDNGGSTGLTINGNGRFLINNANNTYTGVTTVNGGFLDLQLTTVAATGNGVLGNNSGAANFLVINGGTLLNTFNGGATFGKLFTVGLNGATIDNGLGSNGAFNFTNTGALGFQGAGSRTLTFTNDAGGTGASTFNPVIGDNGGPTSVVKNGANFWILTPGASTTGNNTYTGTTTINQGYLRLGSSGALPGGLGYGYNGTTTTVAASSSTGGGNVILNGTTTNAAVLELTAASGDFFRPLGTGFDQVQFTGNGGFGAVGGARVVNLGGNATPTTLVWGSTPSFLGNAAPNTLFFSGGGSDSMLTFMNPINLNGATRTIQADNGSFPIDANLTGSVTGATSASIISKNGLGTLQLSGTNNTGAATLVFAGTTQGRVAFASTASIPGASGRSVTVTAGNEVVLLGAADPTALINRIATASVGAILLDANATTPTNTLGTTLDFSAQTGGLSLGAFGFNGTNSGVPAYFSGTLTPNGTAYRIGSGGVNIGGTALAVGSGGTGTAQNLLVFNRAKTFTGASNTLNASASNNSVANYGTQLAFTNWNDYGGQTPGATPTTTLPVTTANVNGAGFVIGNDSAFGAGNITFGTANTANRVQYTSILGDHTLSNNIDATAANTYFLSGDATAEFMPVSAGAGATTFSGTLSLYGGGIQLYQRSAARQTIFLGDVKQVGGTPTALQVSGAGLVAMLGSNKSFTRGITVNSNNGLIIDRDGSLGVAPATAAVNLTLNTSSNPLTLPSLWVQPGTGAVTLAATRSVSITAATSPAIRVDTGDTLTIPGVVGTGGTTLIKSGAGTLVLQGVNTASFGIIDHRAGNLILDYANYASGAVATQIISSTPALVIGADGTFAGNGTSSSAGGATLTLKTLSGVTGVNPTFGAVTLKGKASQIVIDNSAGGTGTITLGSSWTFASASLGGSIAFVVPTGNSIATTYGTASTLLTDGQGNAIATYGLTSTTQNDWAAKDSGNANIVAGSSVTGFYTNSTSSAVTGNADVVANVTFTAPNTTSSVRFNTTGALTLNTSATATNTLTTGGILVTPNVGANLTTITGTGTITGSGGTNKALYIFQNNTAGNLTIGAPIVDNTAATALVKSGAGKLILTSASNSYTGPTYLNGGTIEVTAISNGNANSTLGKSTNAQANLVFNGGTLRYNSASAGSTDRAATFNSVSTVDVANAQLTLDSGNATGIAGAASTPGILRKIGTGTLVLSGASGSNNTNLSVEVVAGTLALGKIAANAAVQQAQGAALIIDNTATAIITVAGQNQIDDTSSVLVNTGGTLDLNAANEGFDGLAGGGTVTNSATGTSVLTLGTNNSAGISANTIGAALAGVGSTGLNYFSGVLQDGGSGKILAFTKTGAGTQILGGSNASSSSSQNTYSGATTITSGTVKAAVLNVLPFGTGKGDVTLSSAVIGGISVPGVFDVGGFNQKINGLNASTPTGTQSYPLITNTLPATASANATNTLQVGNANANGSFAGVLQDGFTIVPGATTATGYYGFLALEKVGTGTQTLSGPNTATGALTVTQGEVDLNTTGSNAWSGNVTVNQTSGTGTLKLLQSNQIIDSATLTVSGGTMDMNGKTETVSQVVLSSGAISDSAGTSGVLTSTNTFDVRSGTASAVLAGTNGLTKTTGGTVTLSGANTYTGVTTITSGVLSVSTINNGGIAGGLGAASNAATNLVLNGGTLQYTGATATSDRAFTINAGTTGTVDVTTNTLTLAGATGAATTGALTKIGAGNLTLTGTNTYTGATSINNGVLQLGNGGSTGQLSTSSAITISSPGNLTINRNNTVTQGVDFSGGDLTGNGSVTQAGTGTTILNRAAGNSYSGGTTVSLGTLQVGNTSGSATGTGNVTVGTAGTAFASTPNVATLTGTGNITGNVTVGTVNGTGTPTTVGGLAPGVGTTNGTLQITGNLTVDRGSMLTLKISSITTNHDNGIYTALGNMATYNAYITSMVSTYNAFKPTSGESDFLNITGSLKLADPAPGTVTISNNGYVGVSAGTKANIGDFFNLLDWAGALTGTLNGGTFSTAAGFINGGLSGDLNLPTLSSGLAWDVSQFASSGIVIVVPEPSRAILIFFGLAALVTRRRRQVA